MERKNDLNEVNKTGNIQEGKRENTGPNGDRGDSRDKQGEGGNKSGVKSEGEQLGEGEHAKTAASDKPRGVKQGDHPSDVKPGHAKDWGRAS